MATFTVMNTSIEGQQVTGGCYIPLIYVLIMFFELTFVQYLLYYIFFVHFVVFGFALLKLKIAFLT